MNHLVTHEYIQELKEKIQELEKREIKTQVEKALIENKNKELKEINAKVLKAEGKSVDKFMDMVAGCLESFIEDLTLKMYNKNYLEENEKYHKDHHAPILGIGEKEEW